MSATLFLHSQLDLVVELAGWLRALGIQPNFEALDRVIFKHLRTDRYEDVDDAELRRLAYWAMRAHGIPPRQARKWSRE